MKTSLKLVFLVVLTGCINHPAQTVKTPTRAPQEAKTAPQTEAVTAIQSVRLQWDANPVSEHAKYDLYEVVPRSSVSAAKWQKIGSKLTATSFIATGQSGSLHVYALKAVNPFESQFSVPVVYKIP